MDGSWTVARAVDAMEAAGVDTGVVVDVTSSSSSSSGLELEERKKTGKDGYVDATTLDQGADQGEIITVVGVVTLSQLKVNNAVCVE